MSDELDLDFRPETYFRPQRLEDFLLSKVKGVAVKECLHAMRSGGGQDEVDELLRAGSVSDRHCRALESSHPMFMGGNYLPDPEDGEVQIASIRIASTTYDVTSLYAKHDDGQIRYRVVDEYEGETLSERTTMSSSQPLTLGELVDFFLDAWPLVDVLRMNFDDDLDGAIDFFSAESDFYTGFSAACCRRVYDTYDVVDAEEAESDAT
jgi:hypothetical protein